MNIKRHKNGPPKKGNSFTSTWVIACCLAVLFSLVFTAAIKIHYGGEVTIRLNEPDSFNFSPSGYSNMVFYSLIYENLFYLANDGSIRSSIFQQYSYEKTSRTLLLTLKNNLSFSNGDAVTALDIKNSLNLFLERNLDTAKRIRSLIKEIQTQKSKAGEQVRLELLFDTPGITGLLTAPELVLLSRADNTSSGIFFPAERVPGRYIVLKPNKFYPAGRTYLDGMKVLFTNTDSPDVFFSRPSLKFPNYSEYQSGIYQNLYIVFPGDKVGQNTRVALYSLLKDFFRWRHERDRNATLANESNSAAVTPGTVEGGEPAKDDWADLDALTSNEESPISLNIKEFSTSRIRSILRYSTIKLYLPGSLQEMEKDLQEFLKKKRVPIETIYLDDSQLANFMNNTSIQYLVLSKVFTRNMPLEAKIKKIVREMTFSRFNAKYLQFLNELDEVKYLKDDELLLNQVSKIIEEIINDGFVLPLFQERYSIYINNDVEGIEIDYYGRPLFQGVRKK